MDRLKYTSDFAPHLASQLQVQPFLSSFIAIIGLMAVFGAARRLIGFGSRLPIALSDELSSRKQRAERWSFDSRNILNAGYKQFKDRIFGIDTSEGTAIVIPTSFMDELKSHPALSFSATFETLTLPEYTMIKPISTPLLKVFSSKLNPSLGAFMPLLQDLFHKELLKDFPDSKDWKSTKIYQIMFRLVCKSAARSLLGEKASQNERWLKLEEEYIDTAISFIQLLKKWPKPLRPFIYQYVEGYKTLRQHWLEGRAFISELLKEKAANNWEPLQDPPSFFDHICSQYRNLSMDDHLSMQITMFVAGVHTSAAIATHCIFDAAANPACISEIRDEVKTQHQKCGGVLTRPDLAQLTKLDSFIKEVIRFNSPDLTTFARRSSETVILSNGFCIPKGAKLQVPTCAIFMDDEIFEHSQVFDGLRFWRKRQQQNETSKHTLTSVGKRDLEWGYGRHACPGRYMAEITIKLVIVQVLLHWDIKYLPGGDRPQNIEFDGQVLPNTEAEVMMRRIDL